MPVLLYGLEACPLRKSDCSSLDFVVNRFFVKLFKTNNIDVVNYYRMQFNFELPSVTIAQRSRKFADKYRLCDNALSKSFVFR